MNSLEIEVDVSESYINRVAPGQPVAATLDSYPDWNIPASVIAIIPTADRQKATVKVRVGFEALDPRILPEMSVKVAFQSAEEESPVERRIVIPASALREREGVPFVWVIQENRAVFRPVVAAESRDGNTYITSGLATGERVVVEGPDSLADGVSVTENIG